MFPVFYSPDYTLSSHGFDTTRKSRWVAESLQANPIPSVRLLPPGPHDIFHSIAAVHDLPYLEALMRGIPRELAESNDLRWDDGLWVMVQASTRGIVQATAVASWGTLPVTGSLSSGLHHARKDRGAGYCTLNGLAIAAYSIAHCGGDVLIIDLDAHCGGGTYSIVQENRRVWNRVWHLDVSTDPEDSYTPTPFAVQSARHTLDIITDADAYLPTIAKRLKDLASIMHPSAMNPHFSVCIYNAGMDPYEGCAVGGLRGITKEILRARERLVFEWCRTHKIPVAFALAGGYVGPNLTKDELVSLHRLTIQTASETFFPNPPL